MTDSPDFSPEELYSPCISVCELDEATGLCKGCFRTAKEIGAWRYGTREQKIEILKKLRERRAAAGLPPDPR